MLCKKIRKQGGLCTGITQNVVDLLQNYTATTMLANSEFVALLKQTNTDSAKMAEVIGVSDAQLDLENGKVEDVDLAASEDKDIAQNVAEEKSPYRTGIDGYKR